MLGWSGERTRLMERAASPSSVAARLSPASRKSAPAGASLGLARLEEEEIDDDIRSGIGAHRAGREPDRGDQVGMVPEESARRAVALVHRPAADHEGGEASGTEMSE